MAAVRFKYLKRLALVGFWQTLMVFGVLSFDSSPYRWVPSVFAVAALLVPFVGYIAAGYDAPVFARWSPILKMTILTLSSLLVTVVGYTIVMLAGFMKMFD